MITYHLPEPCLPFSILALDHIDEAVGEYEVGVDLDNKQDDADVVDLNLRIDAEDDERSDRIDEYGKQLKPNPMITSHDAHTREQSKREHD